MSDTKIPNPKEQLAQLKSSVKDWNALRYSADFRPDLGKADLSGADLNSAILDFADLRNASLTNAKLNGADLNGADVDGADLTGANLKGEDLKGADLNGADLSDADLSGADLVGAILRGVNLRGAGLGDTVFGDTDLREVLGLKEVVHLGPSTIGIDTLYASGGEIDPVFLRGAGVPDNLIELQESLVSPNALEYYSVFISYSHMEGERADDQSFAKELHGRLQNRGVRCWLDKHQILPGEKIHKAVYEGIKMWDKPILCCSIDSLQSWWVEQELEHALEKERSLPPDAGIATLIPVDLDGHIEKWQHPRGPELRNRLRVNFRDCREDEAKFEAKIDEVMMALTPNIKENPPEPKLPKADE